MKYYGRLSVAALLAIAPLYGLSLIHIWRIIIELRINDYFRTALLLYLLRKLL